MLGFVLGIQHATDPDHLVAVATIVSRERRLLAGALVGALWGLGHMATLTLAAGLLLALNVVLPAGLATGLELLVAVMLVLLGAQRVADAARGIAAVNPEHLLANHDHGHGGRGAETLHSHTHDHGGPEHHAHPHLHPSRRLLAALAADGGRIALRATLVGAIHGVAGTAGVSLLVMATLRTLSGALLYLAVFGVGTIAGMMALTTAMAYPVALAARFRRAQAALAIGAGLASIVFGVCYGVLVLGG
jgi:ABC-type nickel/cobalt efflux system permease component RcnA